MVVNAQQSEIKKPRLRFPGFSGGWEEKRLGEVGNFLGGGTPSKTNSKYWQGDIPWVSSSDISNDDLNVKITRFITNEAIANSATKIIPQNSLLIVSRVGVGKIAIAKVDLCTSQDFTNFIPREDIEIIFSAYLLKSKNKELLSFNQGTSIKGFTKDDLENLKINIPKKKEQQKISEFLGFVDGLIENQRDQKKYLESYKKGMTKKIFDQEIRFKDESGKNFPKWEEKKLGEIAEIIMGQSPDSNAYNTDGQGKPLIQGNADITNRQTRPRNWTTQITKECKVGDIIMTVRAPVGYICKSLHEACVGRGVCAIRNKRESDTGFLFQFLLNFEKNWISLEQGSTFTAINTKDVKNLKTPFPTLLEQQKIASFLKSIDKMIESKQQQITQAEQWKKGLMQGLFV